MSYLDVLQCTSQVLLALDEEPSFPIRKDMTASGSLCICFDSGNCQSRVLQMSYLRHLLCIKENNKFGNMG